MLASMPAGGLSRQQLASLVIGALGEPDTSVRLTAAANASEAFDFVGMACSLPFMPVAPASLSWAGVGPLFEL